MGNKVFDNKYNYEFMDSYLVFTNFLISKGFEIVEKNEKFKFVTYAYDGFFVRIILEQNLKKFIELSRRIDHSWEGRYSMAFVRFFILNENYSKDEVTEFDELSEFFIEHYAQIAEAFSQVNFPVTEQALIVLEKERARIMYNSKW